MIKRGLGSAVSWAGFLLVAVGLSACGSGGSGAGSGSNGEDTSAPQSQHVSGADGYDASYRIVETEGGMTVEAVTADQVQTASCAKRSCAGLCDECAAAACTATGAPTSVCVALSVQCSKSCACGAFGDDRCGFPACTDNPQICYIAAGDPEAPAPGGPAGPDPGGQAGPDPGPGPFESGGASPSHPGDGNAGRPEL